jgi:UDP-N-acetyl-D-mannosaminuronic acid transferase (WecB/TagA/CpsF family)
MDHPFPTREILGVKVAANGRGEAIAFLLERLARRQETKVAFANAESSQSRRRQNGRTGSA